MSVGDADVAKAVRVSFAKVVEYQQRGAIHIHAVIRVDADTDELRPGTITTDQLVNAVSDAAKNVAVRYPAPTAGFARFGDQMRVEPLETADVRLRRRISGYLAKYATKSVDNAGQLSRPIRSIEDLQHRRISAHCVRLAETAWRLGGVPELADLKLRRHAHTFGFRGHWLTKSQHWSTTFGALRECRRAYRLAQSAQDDALEVKDSEPVVWTYDGQGWSDLGEVL